MARPVRICLVGASGLVGSALIAHSLVQPDIRLVGVARREVPLPFGARLEVLVADPSGWDDAIAASGAAVMVCALGTTWRKAGRSEAAFRAVDHDLVVQCGRAARKAGIDHVILVSSVAADPASRRLYLRTKGEAEQALGRMRFRRLDILRPGLLRGSRVERRPLERLGMLLGPAANLALHGSRRKYRAIDAATVARAIAALAREKAAGHFVHEFDSIHAAIRRGRGKHAD